MTEEGRRAAFALAAILVAAVFAGLMVLGNGAGGGEGADAPSAASPADPAQESSTEPLIFGGDDGKGRRRGGRPSERDQSAASAEQVARAEDLGPDEQPPAGAVELVRGSEAQAREFMAAFLRYEVEGASPAVRREIERLASAELAHTILAEEPRVPRGADPPGPGRLVAVQGDAVGTDEVAVVATVVRDGKPSGVLLTLLRRGSGWLVSDVG